MERTCHIFDLGKIIQRSMLLIVLWLSNPCVIKADNKQPAWNQDRVLYNFLNYTGRYYMINGNYERAMDEAVRLQLLSNQNKNEIGLIRSNENLGLIYLLIGRDKDAVNAFEQCMSLLKNKDNTNYEIQIISYLIISNLRLKQLDKVTSNLAYFSFLIDKKEKSNEKPPYP